MQLPLAIKAFHSWSASKKKSYFLYSAGVTSFDGQTRLRNLILYPRMQTRWADWHCEHVCCRSPAGNQLICRAPPKVVMWPWMGFLIDAGLHFKCRTRQLALSKERFSVLFSLSVAYKQRLVGEGFHSFSSPVTHLIDCCWLKYQKKANKEGGEGTITSGIQGIQDSDFERETETTFA